jgi:hypothetical protein
MTTARLLGTILHLRWLLAWVRATNIRHPSMFL